MVLGVLIQFGLEGVVQSFVFLGASGCKGVLGIRFAELFAGSTVCQAFLRGAHLEQNAGIIEMQDHRKWGS